MKKVLLILPVVLCITIGCAHKEVTEQETIVQEENHISETQKEHYRENIALKHHNENYVSYEYQNVRIDEIAKLAAYYCEQKGADKKAYLREIVMRENHSRLATFDCINLQK